MVANVGDAHFVDEHTLELGDGTRLQGSKFIVCAGGHSRRVALPGNEYALTYSDVWTLTKLPRSIAIAGGAATGCQLASIFATFGVQVWLFEHSPHLLAREDESVSRCVTEAFQQRGIGIVVGAGVERIERRDESCELFYTHQDQTRSLSVEAVMMAVGWRHHRSNDASAKRRLRRTHRR